VPVGVFFALFTVSGFAGLIYESIWSHYLKLFLGHAAYAQTLVLAIFMGGMAIGSWLVSRFTHRIRKLLLGYALAELGVGLLAIGFHPLFVSLADWSYVSVLPGMQSAAAIGAFKWTLASLLILPASILLGTTFPLMSAGIMRLYPEEGGRPLAMLYFTNSLGASIGVLASGFYLVAHVGLPGTMLTAGILNIVLALAAWALGKLTDDGAAAPAAPTAGAVADPWRYRALLFAVGVTGMASFIYEIAWIRLLSLGTGSSTHSFEIMLSAFIVGIAFGGLAARRWTPTIAARPGLLAAVFVAKGGLAVLALGVYVASLDQLQWALSGIARSDAGYSMFTAISYVFSVAVMFPTAFVAGLALPLLTQTLLAKGYGEKSIGAVYGANTAGCILGAFFATHIGMEWLGTKGLTAAGALLDLVPAILVLAMLGERRAPSRKVVAAIAAALGAGFLAYTSADFDLRKLASGIYRNGVFLDAAQNEVVFYRDGKTATVAVTRNGSLVSIRTNGKTDASVEVGPNARFSSDEPTMVLLGSLAYAYRPQARQVANIGFGSGLTTHIALGSPVVQQMDTIEIESAMIDGARFFGERNARAYGDPRSRIVVEDAKTFFAAGSRRYDVIISEPSNPWVSGVSSLFSDEFYSRMGTFLVDDGLLVQWLHLYEINDDLVASVFKALSKNFGDYAVYGAAHGDIVIVATKQARLPDVKADLLQFPGVAAELRRIGVRSLHDLLMLRIASKRAIDPLFGLSTAPMNSDYFPIVDQRSAKARFLRQSSLELADLGRDPVSVVRLIDGELKPSPQELSAASGALTPSVEQALAARTRLDYFLGATNANAAPMNDEAWKYIGARAAMSDCRKMSPAWVNVVADALGVNAWLLPAAEVRRFTDAARGSKCVALLPRKDQLRLAFYLDEADANPAGAARAGLELLALDEFTARDESARVIAGTMTALLASNQPRQAMEVWSRYRAKVSPPVYPMVLRLAVAQALRAASGSGAAVQIPGGK
jgi:spermidine synthase